MKPDHRVWTTGFWIRLRKWYRRPAGAREYRRLFWDDICQMAYPRPAIVGLRRIRGVEHEHGVWWVPGAFPFNYIIFCVRFRLAVRGKLNEDSE